jgi:hypothetical protein
MIMTLFLACAAPQDTAEPVMPIEIVSCAHPDSRFEAAVHVEVEDSFSWSSVYFQITQAERKWETNLQTENHQTWWTRMQLYELDCFEDFEYEVDYESR